MNAADLREIPPGKKLYDHYVKGLFALGNRDGSKTFYLYYYDMAKIQRKIKLGKYGQLTLEGARKAAQALLTRVAAGENPALEKRQIREELTVSSLMLRALKEYWSDERFINSGQFKNVLSAVKNNFDAILKFRLSELTPAIIDRWHKSFEDHPCHANLLLAYLMRAINWAKENQLTQINNPCSLVKRFPKKKRNRFATPDEIKKIGKFLEDNFKRDPFPSIFLYLILTTGTRPSAIPRLKWENLTIKKNLQGEEVGIISFFGKTTAKTGEEEVIVIPPKTMAMIKRLPKLGEYIVPCLMPTRLWKKIQEKFNLKDLWARDLRRTYATVGLSGGVSLSQVGELLNHKCWDTTKIYAKLMLDQRINSAMAIAKSLDSIIHH